MSPYRSDHLPGTVGTPTTTEVPPFEDGFSALAEEEQRVANTGITVNVQGNILDRKESGLAIAEIIRDSFDSEGVTTVTA